MKLCCKVSKKSRVKNLRGKDRKGGKDVKEGKIYHVGIISLVKVSQWSLDADVMGFTDIIRIFKCS